MQILKALLICISSTFPLVTLGADFVEIKARLEGTTWPYRDGRSRELEYMRPASGPGPEITCVVGTNRWLMKFQQRDSAMQAWWFDGTNIISSVTSGKADDRAAQNQRTYASVDGNPSMPVRVIDLLGSSGARACWLAYCSADFLKHEGRKIYPPSDIWKETVSAPDGFKDETTTYEDLLGLPMSVDLYTPKGQSIMQYRTVGFATTNVLALPWTFPREFHLAQYRPAWTNGWELQFTIKGTLTSIRQVEAPVELRAAKK